MTDTLNNMGSNDVSEIIAAMRNAPENIKFNDLYKVCVRYFGEPRRTGGSHAIFKVPWQGDPRVNIQADKKMAKRYQVLQVIDAIDRLDNQREGR